VTDPWPDAGTPSEDLPGGAQPPAFPDQAQPPAPPPVYPSPGGTAPFGYPTPFDPGAVAPVPPRRRRGLLISLVVGAVLVVLLALALIPGVLRGDNSAKTGAGSASTSASPAPTPVSPETYQQILDALDKVLTPLLQALPATTSLTAFQNAVQNLEGALKTEINALQGITPPPAVASANRDLVQGLTALDTKMIGYVMTKGVCVGSAALAEISQQSGPADTLRTAFKELETADPARPYKVGTFLPAPIPIPDSNRRLNNGTMIKKISRSGLGKFKIDNKGDGDVVITLAPVGSTAATFVVYVQGKANYTVSGVSDGKYTAYLSGGGDWDSGAKSFTQNCHQEKFDDTFEFKTTGRTYSIWTITLDADTGGNASTSGVDPGGVPT
jgi:hypothetical protein